jgi:tight adherence protein C
MTITQIGFLLLVFVAVFGLAASALAWVRPNAVRQRLRSLAPAEVPLGNRTSWVDRAARLTRPLANMALPEEGWDKSMLRARFMHAGIRGASAPMLYLSVKTLLAVSLPVLVYVAAIARHQQFALHGALAVLLLAAAIGYYCPNLLLAHWVRTRQLEIFETFPDALDLMTVCMEAGLGLEAALNRVADDIQYKSRILSEELRLVGLEIRAGSDRQRALRNLAARTGVEEVETWVAMMIQTDRFGTSLAASLRVHSDMLRTKRRQRAEEAAAKVAVKLLFPLVLCIFPAIMVVLTGPAVIQIVHIVFPVMGATGGMP